MLGRWGAREDGDRWGAAVLRLIICVGAGVCQDTSMCSCVPFQSVCLSICIWIFFLFEFFLVYKEIIVIRHERYQHLIHCFSVYPFQMIWFNSLPLSLFLSKRKFRIDIIVAFGIIVVFVTVFRAFVLILDIC